MLRRYGRGVVGPLFRSGAVLLALWYGLTLAQVSQRPLTDARFEEFSARLSEPGGYFPTDNILSNETSYLHVLPSLKQQWTGRRAYLGVGPDQNFTYIASTRPDLAFIIDVRRDARLQHLFYKELFERAENRWEFLSLLLGVPLPDGFRPDLDADAADLVRYFEGLERSSSYFDQNVERNWRSLKSRFPKLIEDDDRYIFQRMATSFFVEGLNITYRMGRGRRVIDFPSMAELMLETDLDGKRGHFLDRRTSFLFLKRMQSENRLIPVVGDFAGQSALKNVGSYLEEKGCRISAFYLSNVEFYLFRQGIFGRFMENLKALPFDDESVVIRSFFNFWYGYGRHPEAADGYYVTSLVQNAGSFLKHHSEAPYWSYWDLVTRDYVQTVPAEP